MEHETLTESKIKTLLAQVTNSKQTSTTEKELA
jgi:hypothetical protein